MDYDQSQTGAGPGPGSAPKMLRTSRTRVTAPMDLEPERPYKPRADPFGLPGLARSSDSFADQAIASPNAHLIATNWYYPFPPSTPFPEQYSGRSAWSSPALVEQRVGGALLEGWDTRKPAEPPNRSASDPPKFHGSMIVSGSAAYTHSTNKSRPDSLESIPEDFVIEPGLPPVESHASLSKLARLQAEVDSLRKELEEAKATNNQHKQDFLNLQEAHELELSQFSELQAEFSKLEGRVKQGDIELAQFKKFNIFNLKGLEAVAMCDFVQSRLDEEPDAEAGALLLRFLQDLCVSSDQLPTSCWVKGVKVNHVRVINRGGEAIIFHGTYEGRPVAVRSIFPPEGATWESRTGNETIKLIRREILTHRQLKHQNIIPLIGIFQEVGSQTAPSIVLPFFETGSAKSWLKDNQSSEHYLLILLDVVRGLQYLHGRTPPVIHGDLHSGNILIAEGPRAVLCDFGFSRVKHDVSRLFSKIQITQNLRFVAPELFAPFAAGDNFPFFGARLGDTSTPIGDPDHIRSTQQTDIYSLAMTFYDLGTLQFPFHNIASPYTVAEKVLQGERPPQPNSLGGLTDHLNNSLWSIITGMWIQNPHARVPLNNVKAYLDLFGNRSGAERS